MSLKRSQASLVKMCKKDILPFLLKQNLTLKTWLQLFSKDLCRFLFSAQAIISTERDGMLSLG